MQQDTDIRKVLRNLCKPNQSTEKQGGVNATCTATAIEEEKEDNSSEMDDSDSTSSASFERTTAMFTVVLSSVIATLVII